MRLQEKLHGPVIFLLGTGREKTAWYLPLTPVIRDTFAAHAVPGTTGISTRATGRVQIFIGAGLHTFVIFFFNIQRFQTGT